MNPSTRLYLAQTYAQESERLLRLHGEGSIIVARYRAMVARLSRGITLPVEKPHEPVQETTEATETQPTENQ